MNEIYTLAELASTAVESHIIISVFMYAGESKFSGRKKILFQLISTVAFIIGVLAMNQLKLYSLYTVGFTYVAIVLIGILITRSRPVFLATLAAIAFLVIHLMDFIVVLVLGMIFQDITYVAEVATSPNVERLLFLVVSKSMDIMLYFLFRRLLRQMSLLKGRYLMILLINAFLSYLIMTYLFFTVVDNNPATMQGAAVFTWFFILSFMLAAISLSVSITKSQTQHQVNETLEWMNHSMKDNYDKLDADRRKNNKQMHDHNKHLLTLHGLIKSGNYAEATGYLDSLLSRYNEMPDLCRSGETVIDAIINSKISEASERQIRFSYDVRFTIASDISQVDICAILANQIDNAFEASVLLPVEKRRVHVAVWQKNQFAFFKVSNYTEENPMQENQKLYSTKKEREGKQGYGLRSIQETAQKYNGTLQHLYENKCFFSIVSLCFHTVNTNNMTV